MKLAIPDVTLIEPSNYSTRSARSSSNSNRTEHTFHTARSERSDRKRGRSASGSGGSGAASASASTSRTGSMPFHAVKRRASVGQFPSTDATRRDYPRRSTTSFPSIVMAAVSRVHNTPRPILPSAKALPPHLLKKLELPEASTPPAEFTERVATTSQHTEALLDQIRALEATHEKEKKAWAAERIRLQMKVSELRNGCSCNK